MAPEVFEVMNVIVDSVQDDEMEQAGVNVLLETDQYEVSIIYVDQLEASILPLEQACPVGALHVFFIFIFTVTFKVVI